MDDNIKWTIGICDNEKSYRKEVYEICKKYGAEQGIEIEFEIFEDGQEVLDSDKIIDILFFDIVMKELREIDILQKLRDKVNVWRIILATGFKEGALNGYGSKTIGFLEKPFIIHKVFRCLDMAKREYFKNKVVSFRLEGRERLEYIENIVYIEGNRNYVKVYTLGGNFLTYGTIKYWSNQLITYKFVRIHKSYLVNLRYILEINYGTNNVHIKNMEKILPIGRTYRMELKDIINKYKIKRVR